MIWLVMIFVTVLGGFIQAAVDPMPIFGHSKLPILLAVVVYYALNHSTGAASVAALLTGLLMDLLSLMPAGETSMVFLVIALIISLFRKLVHGDEMFTAALFGGGAALTSIFVSYHLLHKDGLIIVSTGALWCKALGSLLLGAIVAPFVFHVIHTVDSFSGNVAVREVVDDVLD